VTPSPRSAWSPTRHPIGPSPPSDSAIELQQISGSDESAIADLVAIRVTEAVDLSDLDAKPFALVNLAALIGVGG
jgi:hypothetical protein